MFIKCLLGYELLDCTEESVNLQTHFKVRVLLVAQSVAVGGMKCKLDITNSRCLTIEAAGNMT